MADIDLNFIARQMQRVLSELAVIRSGLEIVTRDCARINDDLGIIRNDMLSMRSEIALLRHESKAGFDLLDARLRPLEIGRD